MATIDPGRIVNKKRLVFADGRELRRYYEGVWANGGYTQGFVLNGVPLSQIYHKARQGSAIRLLKPKEGERVLDAGCGNGALTMKIAESAGETCGIDIAYSAVQQAANSGPQRGARFAQMDLEKLAFEDGSFDKVVCVEALEHVLNPEKTIEEFYRVLSRNGRLVITYPFVNTSVTAKRRIAADPEKYLSISEHLTEWDYDTLKDKFEKKGFDFVNSEGIVFDLGRLERLKSASKGMTKAFTKIKLAIRGFPRNSTFASLAFRKR